ncbi:MAG: DNA replication and repair protein RecF [Bacteroidetes bacterium]|nr:DNA replication and repair protein RecF [Bacteroidota bacterium]
MILRSLGLRNFRLHKQTNLEFSENLNYIIGGNGQGKTTILEAIYYLCTTKSLNQCLDAEVVNFNETFFEVTGQFRDLADNRTGIYYNTDNNKKSIFIDDKQIYRASAVIGKFPVVTLIQSDHAITQGAPAERRKFVDSIISQASETYLNFLLDYNKILRQRSALLSKIKETNDKSLYGQLEAWTITLVKTGSELVRHRMKFVKSFNEYVAEAYQKIMEDFEVPFINYSFLGEMDENLIEDRFNEELMNLQSDELLRSKNLVGPHRDDFCFSVNGYELRKYGSQGQHKTFQIALRFGQFFYMKDTLGRTPIFLMDDVFGELDTYRANKISLYLKEIGQAFITMTDFSKLENINVSRNDFVLTVKNGGVISAAK